ncbi:MAG TPA: response regulator [Candidatus Manganitrophaceae bacterium]|nr:response regulator [Candidatus Manganitrophaceae bacterium]
MNATILVIEDEVGPRESIKIILKPYYRVVSAENGIKALEILQKEKIDLITLDLRMPELAGEEVLKKIKEIKPEIEVIIISGHASVKSALDGVRYGAADYLLKPFAISDLINTIKKALRRKQRAEELKSFLNKVNNQFGADGQGK